MYLGAIMWIDFCRKAQVVTMEIIEDIVYGNEKLDLYLPENKEFDLFVYFHGGGLERGSKASRPHIYKHLASCGVAAASVDYRMYPQAKYPDFIEDCAQAVAWLKENIANYGNCRRIFVGGSSAGGYISMMLCFDKLWLGKYGIDPMDIDGFVHDAGQPTKHFNVLKEHGVDERRIIVDETAPLYHVGMAETYPPMIFIVSDNDMKNRFEQTQLMISTLRHFGHEVPLVVRNGNHCHYVRQKNEDGSSPLAEMILDFVDSLTV